MEWVNIHASTLHSPEFIGSDPTARATWLCVLGYCHGQENGGRIADCQEWGDRRWMQTAGVTRAELDAASLLIHWDGKDLVCAFYPLEKESEIQAKRKGGGDAVRRRWAKKKAAESEAASLPSSPPLTPANSSANSSANTEGKGRELERKGIGTVPAEKNGFQDHAQNNSRKKLPATCGINEIMDTANDPVDVAAAITGEKSDKWLGYWRKCLEFLGAAHFRSLLATFEAEIRSGEGVQNRGAAFTAKLTAAANAKRGKGL